MDWIMQVFIILNLFCWLIGWMKITHVLIWRYDLFSSDVVTIIYLFISLVIMPLIGVVILPLGCLIEGIYGNNRD